MAGTTPLAALPYPGSLDEADIPGDIQAALLAVERQLVLAFSTSTARDSAIPSPTAGMVAYLTTPKQLTLYDGSGWIIVTAEGTWTPTLTNVAIGTGGSASNTGAYSYVRGLLTVDIAIVLGSSGSSVSGAPTISLPAGFTPARSSASVNQPPAVTLVAGGASRLGVATVASTISVFATGVSGSFLFRSNITSSSPGTWASGDSIYVQGSIKGTLA